MWRQQGEQLRSSSCICNQIATLFLSRQALQRMPEILMSHDHAHCLQSMYNCGAHSFCSDSVAGCSRYAYKMHQLQEASQSYS